MWWKRSIRAAAAQLPCWTRGLGVAAAISIQTDLRFPGGLGQQRLGRAALCMPQGSQERQAIRHTPSDGTQSMRNRLSNTAASAAIDEAFKESGVKLPAQALARLHASLTSRIASATPRLLTSSRATCPACSAPLYQALGYLYSLPLCLLCLLVVFMNVSVP